MQRLHLYLLLIFTSITAHAAEIRIAISDLIADDISETIQELAKESAVEISIISIGSLPAIDSLRADEISLAIVVTPENSDSVTQLLDNTYKSFTFAYSTAVVAVNEANPINEVSFYNLQGIYGSDPDLSVENWSSLGVGSLVGRSIRPLIKRDEKSVSAELFRYTVLQGEAMKLAVNEAVDSEIEEMLVNNKAAVAVLPYLPDNPKIKALMISTDSESPAFGPTNDNVYYGDYPIRLPFQIVYKEERESELSEVLRILLSDEVTNVIRTNHLFVVPNAIRESLASSLGLVEQTE